MRRSKFDSQHSRFNWKFRNFGISFFFVIFFLFFSFFSVIFHFYICTAWYIAYRACRISISICGVASLTFRSRWKRCIFCCQFCSTTRFHLIQKKYENRKQLNLYTQKSARMAWALSSEIEQQEQRCRKLIERTHRNRNERTRRNEKVHAK